MRWLYLLLLAAPAAYIAEIMHAPHLVVFILASIGIIPLAGLIGLCTEALAHRLGHGIGGLLNATFGNAAEIIIGLTALAITSPEIVRATLSGSIIGNSLLVLGLAMLTGGWKYRRQRFNKRIASQYAVMLTVAVIGMAIPSLLASVGESTRMGDDVISGNSLHQMSIGVAIILLVCYMAYIAFSVFGVKAHHEDIIPIAPHATTGTLELDQPTETASTPESSSPSVEERQTPASGPLATFAIMWRTKLWLPLVGLGLVTAATAFMSEMLVSTINPLTEDIGLNPFFVGLIILPLVGNAAEHFSAITSAAQDHMEISMAITAGSSIQIALLAAPVLVIAGVFMGKPLDLNFTLFEVGMFGLVAGLYALISIDGESNWLEGLLLFAFYIILAFCTYFTPS